MVYPDCADDPGYPGGGQLYETVVGVSAELLLQDTVDWLVHVARERPFHRPPPLTWHYVPLRSKPPLPLSSKTKEELLVGPSTRNKKLIAC